MRSFVRATRSFFTPGVVWTAFVTLAVFIWAIHAGRGAVEARALCFVTLILMQFFNAFNCRSEHRSLFQIGVFANKWLWLAIIWECVILIFLLYIPVLQRAFRTFPLGAGDWLIVISSASTIFIVAEMYKFELISIGNFAFYYANSHIDGFFDRGDLLEIDGVQSC